MNQPKKRRVLVLYTGGTAGMRKGTDLGGWKPGTLEQLHEAIPELKNISHDVDYRTFHKDGKLIDSSEANGQLYNDLAREIADDYDQYDGFVVLFGTDTMAPSAAAISYLLEGINKPIVFTGSMRPAVQEGSDAPQNILDAINVAAQTGNEGNPVLRDVTVCIAGKLWRAVSSNKDSASSVDAFNNYEA